MRQVVGGLSHQALHRRSSTTRRRAPGSHQSHVQPDEVGLSFRIVAEIVVPSASDTVSIPRAGTAPRCTNNPATASQRCESVRSGDEHTGSSFSGEPVPVRRSAGGTSLSGTADADESMRTPGKRFDTPQCGSDQPPRPRPSRPKETPILTTSPRLCPLALRRGACAASRVAGAEVDHSPRTSGSMVSGSWWWIAGAGPWWWGTSTPMGGNIIVVNNVRAASRSTTSGPRRGPRPRSPATVGPTSFLRAPGTTART